MLIDLGGSKLNHLRATFFSVIEKALHLMRSEAPAKVILDLKASILVLAKWAGPPQPVKSPSKAGQGWAGRIRKAGSTF